MADTSINDSQLVEDKVSSQSMQSEDNSQTMAEEETETESEPEDQTEETEIQKLRRIVKVKLLVIRRKMYHLEVLLHLK